MERKIGVINAGGTFGMVDTEAGLAPAGDLKRRLLAVSPELTPESFDLIDLDPLIDSSDLKPSDWTTLGQIIQTNLDRYCAFIVIHGTDTLAYSAAALSFIFRNLDKALILTGSQVPLGKPNTDALTNFLDALALAQEPSLRGVYLCFGGRVLLGSRARKLDAQSFQAFDTPNLSGMLEFPKGQSQARIEVPQFRDGRVATLFIYPGIPALLIDALSEDERIDAILLLSFGSGNLPTLSSDFTEGLRRAKARGKLIVNLTQCLRGRVVQGAYATGSVLAEIGALDGRDITPEAAFAKMHYLLATCTDKQAVADRWSQPLAAEVSAG